MSSPQQEICLYKDSKFIESIMKELEINESDKQALNSLLELNYKYSTRILEDTKKDSFYADTSIDVDDDKVAIQMENDGISLRSPLHENPGGNETMTDTITTAEEQSQVCQKIKKENDSTYTKPETGVNDLNDFELKELIGTLISNQESVEINDIDELEAQSFEDFIL